MLLILEISEHIYPDEFNWSVDFVLIPGFAPFNI